MSTIIKMIDPWELADLKAKLEDNTTTDDSIILYYKLNKQLGFVNAIGDALSADTTVTLWYSRTPLPDGSEDISKTVEPIIDQKWDNCLVYAACFEMTGDPKWEAMYQRELRRMVTLQKAVNDRRFVIQNTEEYD